jgi:UDP-N-acetyl-D-mannosaminuronic acid dehydrogenase
VGVGGHCISVDPWFLVEAAPNKAQLILNARRVNDSQPAYLVDFIKRKTGDLTGKRIAALGLAYKADVDDLRESPAVTAVEILRDSDANVSVYEPFKLDFIVEDVRSVASLKEVLKDAEIILLLVGHSQFKTLDPKEIRKLTHAKFVIDAVNAWQREDWQAAGFTYFHLGDGKH